MAHQNDGLDDYLGDYGFDDDDDFEISNVEAPPPPRMPETPIGRHTLTIQQGRSAPVDYTYEGGRLTGATSEGRQVQGRSENRIGRTEEGDVEGFQTFITNQQAREDDMRQRLDQMFAGMPYSQADVIRQNEIRNGIADTERKLRNGEITPATAQETINQMLTPMAALRAREQMHKAKMDKEQEQKIMRDNAQMAAIDSQNELVATGQWSKLPQIDFNGRQIPIARKKDGTFYSPVLEMEEQQAKIAKAKEAAEPKPYDEGKGMREAIAAVKSARPEVDPKSEDFAPLAAAEAHARRELAEPFDPESATEFDYRDALTEFGELEKMFPKASQRSPAVAQYMRQLSTLASTYATNARLQGKPVGDTPAVKPSQALPGQKVKWSEAKSADEIADRLRRIDAELAKRNAAPAPAGRFGTGSIMP